MITGDVVVSRRASRLGSQPIADLMTQALSRPELISLAAGFVDTETLPTELTSEIVNEVFADTHHAKASLQYGTNAGDPRLRQAVIDRWYADDDLDVDDLVVSAGSNQLLYLLSQVLLDPGDIVLCASPTYLVFLGILEGEGARAVGVETDDNGMIPESLDECLRSLSQSGEIDRVKAVYVVPFHDNPAGRTTSHQRQAGLVEIANKWSTDVHPIYVIMDSAYQELHYEGDVVPRLTVRESHRQLLIDLGTFSKCFSPGLRVGWAAIPQPLRDLVLQLKGNLDFGSPNFAQQIARGVLRHDRLDTHLQELRSQYRTKRDVMLAALDAEMQNIPGVHWETPAGGLYVWFHLPEGMSAGPDGQVLNRALDEGVIYVPGQYCFPAEGSAVAENTMRLSFGVQSCDRIQQGVKALARAIGTVN